MLHISFPRRSIRSRWLTYPASAILPYPSKYSFFIIFITSHFGSFCCHYIIYTHFGSFCCHYIIYTHILDHFADIICMYTHFGSSWIYHTHACLVFCLNWLLLFYVCFFPSDWEELCPRWTQGCDCLLWRHSFIACCCCCCCFNLNIDQQLFCLCF